MMRPVVEKMCKEDGNRVVELPPLIVHIGDVSPQRLRLQRRDPRFDPGVLDSARRPQAIEILVENCVETG